MRTTIALKLLLFAGLTVSTLPVLAETRIEKSLRLEPGGRFALEAEGGSVTVAGTSAPGARVVITSRRSDLESLFDFRFEEGPGSVTVTSKRRRRHLFGIGSTGSLHFDVQIPAQTNLTVDTSGGRITVSGMRQRADLNTSGGSVRVGDQEGDLAAKTSGGSIEVRNLKGDLSATTSGGSINLAGVSGRSRLESSGGTIEGSALTGSVDATTSGGSILLDSVGADIDAQTSGGSIRVAKAGGRVDAETSGGSIDVAFTSSNARGGVLGTSGGGIRVSLDPAVDLEIDASGGRVKSDLPLRVRGEMSRHRLQGTLGKGGETLRLRVSGGSITIEPLKAGS